jgi:hypothetical protein
MAKAAVNQVFADILTDLNKDSKSGAVQFLKDGDTTVKLVLPQGRTDLRQFYESFMATWKGEQFRYFLVAGVITEADEDGVADVDKVRYIKVTKTILLEIVNLLTKRWKLFDDEGSLIVITKGKKQGKASYSVAAIPETFNSAGLPFPDQSIEDAAADQERQSADLDVTQAAEAKGEELK